MYVRRVIATLMLVSFAIASDNYGRRRPKNNRVSTSVNPKRIQLPDRSNRTEVEEKDSTIDDDNSSDYIIIENTSEKSLPSEEELSEDIDLEGRHCKSLQKNCICVPWFQCKVDNIVVTDGEGLVEERKKPAETRCKEGDVCCNLEAEDENKSAELKGRALKPSTQFSKCGQRNSCGIDRRLLEPKAKGEADFGEWPWQAIVLTSIDDEEGKYKYNCGAALIGNRWVVTIAHCIHKLKKDQLLNLYVRLGEWDVKDDTSDKEFLKHSNHKVSQIHIHPNFNPRNLRNDIALLELEELVTFQPHISPVCIASDKVIQDSEIWLTDCVSTGWGKMPDGDATYSRILKELLLPLIPNGKCQNLLRKTRLGEHFVLHSGFLCAGGEEGIDSCKGDGGGPLVCYHKNKWILVGIVSWGIGCGQKDIPGVYVNVPFYSKWINAVVNS